MLWYSSVGNGGFNAFLRNCAQTEPSPTLLSIKWQFYGTKQSRAGSGSRHEVMTLTLPRSAVGRKLCFRRATALHGALFGFILWLIILRLNRTIPHTTFHQMVNHFMENYMFFQLKVRFNIRISLTGMSHQMVYHFVVCQSFYGKLYVLPIESAFKYSHQLNRNESSNGFHILRSHFKFTYSVAFSENYGSVTFSENRKSMMSYHRDFPVE